MKNAGGIKLTEYRVVISLREDFLENRNEFRDSFDINWHLTIESILRKKVLIFPMANYERDVEKCLNTIEPNLIILSGGKDSKRRNSAETRIIEYSIERSLPLFGICHGMQMINKYFGGTSERINNHVAISHEIISVNQTKQIKFQVNSFHTLGIKEECLGNGLQPLFKDDKGYIEAYMHEGYNILGIMWHPERYHDSQGLIQKWLNTYLNKIMDN